MFTTGTKRRTVYEGINQPMNIFAQSEQTGSFYTLFECSEKECNFTHLIRDILRIKDPLTDRPCTVGGHKYSSPLKTTIEIVLNQEFSIGHNFASGPSICKIQKGAVRETSEFF